MNPLPQNQLDAMVSAGKGIPAQDTSGALSKEQLDAMVGASLTPNQSATLLGHATNAFYNPLLSIQQGNSGDNTQHAIGAGKQALSEISSVGMQNAGPVGKQIMTDAKAKGGGAAQFAGAIDSANQAMKPSNIAQAQGAAETGIGEGIAPIGVAKSTGLLQKVSDATGLSDYLARRATQKATEAVSSTAETMTKGERNTAIAERRQAPTPGGGGKYVPSETEQNAGKLLSGRLESNPVKNVPIIQDEIATRGKAAETYLEQNAKPISNEEDFNAFAAKRTEMARYSTDAEMKAYDDQVRIFSQQLLGRGGNNTANYYKALKEYETNVTSRLPKGKEALLTETGSAKLQAAKDVRSVVRDMIGSKNPEFKPQMYDLASLYNALDNTITKAESVGRSGLKEFAKRHPIITGAATFGVGDTALRKVQDWTGL